MDLELQKIALELDTYIASCKNRLKTILSALDWTEEDTLKENTCSRKLSEEHKIDDGEPPLPESFDSLHSVVIGQDQLKTILKTDNVSIPQKFSDIQLNYTREQKLEIYDYVIFNTGKISEPELKVSVSNDNHTGNDMTFAEIVAKAKKKDKHLKRKYRTSKPTHIEEVRNLVNLQMQVLAQYFNPKSPITEEQERRKYQDDEKEERFRHSRSRSRKRWRSPYRKKSRSKEWKKQSQDRESYNVGKVHRNRAMKSTSRGSRSKSVTRSQSKKRKHHRHSRSRSSISAASHSRNYESSTSHRKEKRNNHSSTKKHKKRSRCRSKSRRKSSKSKKHKNRGLQRKIENKEEQP